LITKKLHFYFQFFLHFYIDFNNWFGDAKSCLHLAIDKATSIIVGAYFDKQEMLNGYYHVFYQILTNYGIPYKFITDNRTVFNYMPLNPDKRTIDKDVLTQYGYACKQLGIELETSSVSQAKVLIERTNGTFQGRLVNELKLHGITTIEEANKYLIDVFVPYFNQRFAMDYTKFKSVHVMELLFLLIPIGLKTIYHVCHQLKLLIHIHLNLIFPLFYLFLIFFLIQNFLIK